MITIMSKYYIMVLSILGIFSLSAQSRSTVEKNQFKINVLLPGFVYEYGFNEKNTLYSEVSSGFGIRTNFLGGTSWLFYPTINEQFRHYFNLNKRALKGKRTAHNSGNFVALNLIYNFREISTNKKLTNDVSSLTIAPVWGLQRTYKRNFNLGLNLGVGYNLNKYHNKFDNRYVPVINFTLGWVIGK